MNQQHPSRANEPNHLAQKVTELHDQLRQVEPEILESRTGSTYLPVEQGRGTFHVLFWGEDVTITYPEFEARTCRTGQILDTFSQALLAYYFTLTDGTPYSGRWISFSELPDATFYNQAFQGYSGNELAKAFGDDRDGFCKVAQAIGGKRLDEGPDLGDEAFAFLALPKVKLLVVNWLGDEDFPSTYQILFDANTGHHLSTDACAILGSLLTRWLIKTYNRIKNH
jgi:hypothetical protein